MPERPCQQERMQQIRINVRVTYTTFDIKKSTSSGARHTSVRATVGSSPALAYPLSMATASINSCFRPIVLSVLTALAVCLPTSLAAAQGLAGVKTTKILVEQAQERALPLEERAQLTYDAYMLGPGDGLAIEVLDLPELSGRFSIGPDGTIHLPRLRSLYVEGLTIEELRQYLTQQFTTYVLDPQFTYGL